MVCVLLVQVHRPSLALGMLLSQQVVEYLRGNTEADVKAALEWMRTRLAALQHPKPNVAVAIKDCCSLMAYKHPDQSPMRHMFDLSRRTLTGEALNQHILRHELGVSEWSPLHVVLRQLTCCRQLLREQEGNRGPVYSCRQLCQPIVRQTNNPAA
eukprot:GHVQ01019626.1.p1 GENE.GHVQ01019626.1~~GHVQ01019626.1.p1  ORF type:complete len:155 (-),score=10.34 GHVQ01019626.1:424-888(-)